jgi:hypothetical protein
MANVVADVTAHIARHNAQSFASMYGGAATPAQVAAKCGYPGSKASALRQHLARQHGQGAQRTGHGRYPALTLAQWQQALRIAQAVRKPEATAQARSKASAQVGKLLWAQRKGAGQAKRQAAQRKAQQAGQQAEPTAQASGAQAS